MISYAKFGTIKKGVRMINGARGGIIDEVVLAKAVKEGKVAGAAMDVFENEPLAAESELLKLENVITTPHLGASTEEAQVNVAIEVAEIVRDALLGKGIRNAANYPCLDAESCNILNPYINLGERLGMFAAQLVEGRFQELVISYSGQITKYNLSPVTMALVKGILTPILKDTVNFVNGLSLLKERGIKLLESKSGQEGEFVNLIQLEIKTDQETKSIMGTLSGNKQPRIVKIDDYYLDLYPTGEMIFIRNLDKPGLIGNLGTLMAKNSVNIAAMALGRNKPGDQAISVWSVDKPITTELQDKVKQLENIVTVKVIRLEKH